MENKPGNLPEAHAETDNSTEEGGEVLPAIGLSPLVLGNSVVLEEDVKIGHLADLVPDNSQ